MITQRQMQVTSQQVYYLYNCILTEVDFCRYVDKTTLKDTMSLQSSTDDTTYSDINDMMYKTYVHDEIERAKEMVLL